jgi:hypothetical protein
MVRRPFTTIAMALTALASLAPQATAQSRRESTGREPRTGGAPDVHRVATAVRATGAITLDGRLDDAAWRQAERADAFTQVLPDGGRPATQATDARVLFDATAIYVGMRLHDAAADSIVAPLGRRDFAGYSDWAHVILDSYNDRRTAFRFAVNPAGVRRDGYITGDQEGTEDLGWDAVWDAAVSRDSSGWTAEFRIPLSQLRFSVGAGAEWGVQFARDIARRSERSTWTLSTPDLSGFVSRFGTLRGIRPPERQRRMEAMPFSVAELTSRPADPGNPYFRQSAVAPRAGLDFKLGVTSDLTLTGTVAPDFGQVEADPSIVNLSGVENFFAERRPFFTEGSDIFLQSISAQGWVSGQDQLFYSRRIGRTPQAGLPDQAEHREPVRDTRLLGALKLSGKTSTGWSIGTLSAITDEMTTRWSAADGARGRSVVEPMSHYGVARLAKDFAGGEATVGAILTSTSRRLDGTALGTMRDGALVGGLTGRRRFDAGRWQLDGTVMASRVRGSAEAITATQRNITHGFQRPDAPYLRVDSSATSLDGVAASLALAKTAGGRWRGGMGGSLKTPGFEANDLGFVPRTDVIHAGAWLGYLDFRPGARTRQRSAWFNAFHQTTTSGERTLGGAIAYGQLQFNSFRTLHAEARVDAPALATQLLRGGPALMLPTRASLWLRLDTDPRRRVSATVSNFYLRSPETFGYVHNMATTVTLRPSSRAELTLGPVFARNRNPWQYVATRTAAGGTRYVTGDLKQVTTSLTTRVNYAFTPDLTLQLYAQPFLAAGRFEDLYAVTAPRAARWRDRLTRYTERSALPDGRLRLGSGAEAVTVDDPDFSVGEFRGNAVLRWEYRPGSALFVVWSQRRDASGDDGRFDFTRQSGSLFGDGGTNVLTVKWSHWIGR